jgi:hypothetical protein
MTKSKKKPRVAGSTARGADRSLHLDGFRQPGIYRPGASVATILREIRDEAGRFQGLEVAR